MTDVSALTRWFAGCDAVIHLAAVPGPFRLPVDELMSFNLIGTTCVLEAAVQAGVETVVFPSSGAASGFAFQSREVRPLYLPLDEEHPAEPQDEYGLSKLSGELICARYSRRYGIRACCLRICNTWFVDERDAVRSMGSAGWARSMTVEGIWSVYRRMVSDPEGPVTRPGPPLPRHMLYSFVDSRDVTDALASAAESAPEGHLVAYLIGGETCSSVPTLELIGRHFHSVPLRGSFGVHDSLIANSRARSALHVGLNRSWRHSDFAAWLGQ